MDINDFKEDIKLLVGMIANQQYDSIRSSVFKNISKQGLHNRIQEYGRTIIPLPDESFKIAEIYNIEKDQRLDVYIPLWTKEEGRSDLTLFVSCRIINDKKELEINDVEVL